MHLKVKILFWVCLVLFLFPFSISAFIMAPPKIELSIPSGGTREFILTIINENETEASFRLYSTDVRKTSKGKLQFPPPGTTSYSCADYIHLETTSFLLPPYGRKEIKCKISLPPGVSGGRYAIIMCELVSEDTAKGGIVVAPHWRIGTIIKAIVMGTERKKVRLARLLHFPPSEKEGRKFLIAVANEGNVCIKEGKGYVSIMDSNKRVIQRITLEAEKNIFPEGEKEIIVYTKTLPANKYKAIASIDYQGIRSVSKEIEFMAEEKKFSKTRIFDNQNSFGIIVEPEIIELEIPQGGFRTCGLSISNQEEFPVNIKIEMKDINYNDQGEERCLDLGKTSYSLKDIAGVKPEEFMITPHEKKNVRIGLTIPKGGVGGLYSKLIINGSTVSKDYIFSGRKEVNIAIAISKTIKKAGKINKVGKIKAVNGNSKKNTGIDFAVEFLNLGNVLLRPKGELRVQNMAFKEVAKALFAEVAVMPAETVIMRTGFPRLPAGKYRVKTIIDYGEKEDKQFWNGEITVK